MIDKETSALYLSKHITVVKTRALMRMSRFVIGHFPAMYLAVSLVSGRLTAQVLEPLINKVRNIVAGSKMKLLSQGGQLVLLKHVLSCMSTHMLAALDIPKGIFLKTELHP